jgi:hypothetical protein
VHYSISLYSILLVHHSLSLYILICLLYKCTLLYCITYFNIQRLFINLTVMNSFQKLDSTLLTNDLKSKFQDFLYVGFLTLPIPPPPLPPSHSDATGCLPWLDRQKLSSVAYISFGTVAAVSPNEAEALEASGVPFLWSLRDNLKQLLPNGFVQRTSASMQGKIVAWAPQSQVLAHSAVGVYRYMSLTVDITLCLRVLLERCR